MRWPKWNAGLVVSCAAALLMLGVASALVVAYSGVYNVAASIGHPKLFEWFRTLGMQRSVAFHSRGIRVPELRGGGMIALGAVHYHSGCEICHGAPGRPVTRVLEGMLPPPPRLEQEIAHWKDRELYWIVRHGLQYTGMPAWAGEGRGDEIWPVVAFLRQMPGMDSGTYRALIAGNASEMALETGIEEPGDSSALDDCARCHDTPDAAPAGAYVPRLAAQPREYLERALREYREDARQSGYMEPVSARLDDREIRGHAAHFSRLVSPPVARLQGVSPERVERGKRLAKAGDITNGIPPCDACHGAGGLPIYPRLAGQQALYLEIQLQVWKNGGRVQTPEGRLMSVIASRLSPSQIADVAAYYQGVPP